MGMCFYFFNDLFVCLCEDALELELQQWRAAMWLLGIESVSSG